MNEELATSTINGVCVTIAQTETRAAVVFPEEVVKGVLIKEKIARSSKALSQFPQKYEITNCLDITIIDYKQTENADN